MKRITVAPNGDARIEDANNGVVKIRQLPIYMGDGFPPKWWSAPYNDPLSADNDINDGDDAEDEAPKKSWWFEPATIKEFILAGFAGVMGLVGHLGYGENVKNSWEAGDGPGIVHAFQDNIKAVGTNIDNTIKGAMHDFAQTEVGKITSEILSAWELKKAELIDQAFKTGVDTYFYLDQNFLNPPPYWWESSSEGYRRIPSIKDYPYLKSYLVFDTGAEVEFKNHADVLSAIASQNNVNNPRKQNAQDILLTRNLIKALGNDLSPETMKVAAKAMRDYYSRVVFEQKSGAIYVHDQLDDMEELRKEVSKTASLLDPAIIWVLAESINHAVSKFATPAEKELEFKRISKSLTRIIALYVAANELEGKLTSNQQQLIQFISNLGDNIGEISKAGITAKNLLSYYSEFDFNIISKNGNSEFRIALDGEVRKLAGTPAFMSKRLAQLGMPISSDIIAGFIDGQSSAEHGVGLLSVETWQSFGMALRDIGTKPADGPASTAKTVKSLVKAITTAKDATTQKVIDVETQKTLLATIDAALSAATVANPALADNDSFTRAQNAVEILRNLLRQPQSSLNDKTVLQAITLANEKTDAAIVANAMPLTQANSYSINSSLEAITRSGAKASPQKIAKIITNAPANINNDLVRAVSTSPTIKAILKSTGMSEADALTFTRYMCMHKEGVGNPFTIPLEVKKVKIDGKVVERKEPMSTAAGCFQHLYGTAAADIIATFFAEDDLNKNHNAKNHSTAELIDLYFKAESQGKDRTPFIRALVQKAIFEKTGTKDISTAKLKSVFGSGMSDALENNNTAIKTLIETASEDGTWNLKEALKLAGKNNGAVEALSVLRYDPKFGAELVLYRFAEFMPKKPKDQKEFLKKGGEFYALIHATCEDPSDNPSVCTDNGRRLSRAGIIEQSAEDMERIMRASDALNTSQGWNALEKTRKTLLDSVSKIVLGRMEKDWKGMGGPLKPEAMLIDKKPKPIRKPS